MNWHCITNGAQRGPMPLDELQSLIRNGFAKPEDYVWNESFGEQWRRIREVPELAQSFPSVPPPEMSPMPVVAPVIQTPLKGVPGQRPGFALAMHQAWERMLELLFRRGSLARWLGMAFCVWISIVGLNEPNLAGEALLRQAQPDAAALTTRLQSCTTPEQMMAFYGELWDEMSMKAHEVLTPPVIKTALGIWVLLLAITCWLRARGAFMVMHCWHHPDASIAQSWAAGRDVGRSLFLFRLGFGAVMCAVSVILGLTLQAQVIVPLINGAPFEGALASHGFLLVLGLSLVLTVWMTVVILVNHFVVPIMYWRRVGIGPAWQVVMEFCNERPGAMTVYFTMYFLLLHVLLAVLAVVMCCTCCCLSYLCIIPFLNGIVYLPGTLFFRGLGISFLRQWRPDLETTGHWTA